MRSLLSIDLLANVKEHANLLAGASFDHEVEVVTTEKHVNRAADKGCCVTSSRLFNFCWVLGSHLNILRIETPSIVGTIIRPRQPIELLVDEADEYPLCIPSLLISSIISDNIRPA